MKTLMIAAALAVVPPSSMPTASAQDSSYTPGSYWEVSMLSIEPGQEENYADYLAANWKRSQEFAKRKGWIEDYHVLANSNPRDGEPDLYLLVRFNEMTTRAQERTREREYNDFMKTTTRDSVAASGERVKMRTQMGSMLLRELMLK